MLVYNEHLLINMHGMNINTVEVRSSACCMLQTRANWLH